MMCKGPGKMGNMDRWSKAVTVTGHIEPRAVESGSWQFSVQKPTASCENLLLSFQLVLFSVKDVSHILLIRILP